MQENNKINNLEKQKRNIESNRLKHSKVKYERLKGHVLEMWNKLNFSTEQRVQALLDIDALIPGAIWEKDENQNEDKEKKTDEKQNILINKYLTEIQRIDDVSKKELKQKKVIQQNLKVLLVPKLSGQMNRMHENYNEETMSRGVEGI